ncbi:hypothetical protein RJ639_043950 [Escallonia herrerae]|uniref:BHLH domain-containing protein n=1 Tax=Escallonia herrerae TaxID=1293975 RepID=A0AA88WCR7_9ASTE|nr:hypothetical protein RJ639_043950 [Escallonia herrerae]
MILSQRAHPKLILFLQIFEREEHLEDVESIEQQHTGTSGYWAYCFSRTGEEPLQLIRSPSLDDDKMPFLQMLDRVLPFTEQPSFQLLRLQHQKMLHTHNYLPLMDHTSTAMSMQIEPESCLTHVSDPQPLVRSESHFHPHSASYAECHQKEQEPNSVPPTLAPIQRAGGSRETHRHRLHVSPVAPKRKRKRARRLPKDRELVESMRMTHIAVERNRRRQMNDYLTALRSLMPPSYVPRCDQATIVEGAIDFVKELEQLLQSLQAQKSMRETKSNGEAGDEASGASLVPPIFMPPQFGVMLDGMEQESNSLTAESRSAAVNVQVTVIQNHANLKVECGWRQGQLTRIIMAMEELRLTVLHLNITSTDACVHYSFSLKIEEDCKVGSAVQIVGAVHQIFSFNSAT